MRYVLSGTGVALLAGAAYLLLLGIATTPAPLAEEVGVSVTPAVCDFGEVSRSEVVTAKFVVKNTLTVPITAGAISRGCSCSDAAVVPEMIRPGGTAEVTLTWTLRGKRGASSETVSFPYAGPGGVEGVLRCRVTGLVHGPVDPDKDVVEVTTEARTADVGYVSKMGRTFVVTGATTSHPALTATVLPGGRRVRVCFNSAVSGWESGQLFLVAYTDQPDEPEVRVWVRVTRLALTKG